MRRTFLRPAMRPGLALGAVTCPGHKVDEAARLLGHCDCAGHPARGYMAAMVSRSPGENPGRGSNRRSRRADAQPGMFEIRAVGAMTEPASSEW